MWKMSVTYVRWLGKSLHHARTPGSDLGQPDHRNTLLNAIDLAVPYQYKANKTRNLICAKCFFKCFRGMSPDQVPSSRSKGPLEQSGCIDLGQDLQPPIAP